MPHRQSYGKETINKRLDYMKRIVLSAVAALVTVACAFSQTVKIPLITRVPDSLKLDTTFYKKYMNVNGLAVCSSAKVPDSCFAAAYVTFDALTRMLPDDVMKSLLSHGARVTIMAKDEMTCDVPEHADLKNDPNTDWNKRARGLGGTLWLPMSSCAEENIMCYPGDHYWREDITIHEFSHTIHNVGITPVHPEFNDELKASLDSALAHGRFVNTYAANNIEEYWAEGVQSWFNVNTEVDYADGDGVHNMVNTRAELKEYDPNLYSIIARFFPDTYTPVSRHSTDNKFDWLKVK